MATYQFLKPLTFKNKAITLKNRIVIPPMTECMSFEDGTVSSDEIRYFGQRAGGVCMFITGTSNVNPLGKGFEGELGVYDDRFIPQLSKLAAAMKVGGTKAILQIFSAGLRSDSKILRGEQPVSASAVDISGHEIPRALTNQEILNTLHDFTEATRRVIQAGFDGVEIHGANGYLLQQFFSPNSNRRSDEWGGSLEKRMKFPLAVVDAVTQAVDEYATGPFIVGYRISPEELEEPGISLADTLKLVQRLKNKPLDYLHLSQSNVWNKPERKGSEDVIIADAFKKALDGAMPLIVVGSIKTPQDAEKAAKQYDLVAIGHELIYEPKWVQKVENHDEGSIRYKLSKSELTQLGIMPPYMDMIAHTVGGIKNVPFTTK